MDVVDSGMGLDGVELVMEFEEAFQIEISDSDAEKMFTVGDVVDLVEQRLKDLNLPSLTVPESEESEKKAHFERVASAFQCDLDMKRDLKLKDILPLQKRIESWKKIRAVLGRFVPSLHRPALVTIVIWIVAIVCGVSIFMSSCSVFFGSFGTITVFVAGIYMTRSLKFNFQRDIQTLGELTDHLFRRMPGSERERIQQAEFSRAAILKEVAMIVAEQLGVDESDCTEDARFIEDLGMG